MITKINLKDRTIKSYAIRKFTPRECFRLMGVREGYIDKLQATAEKAREMFPARRLQAKGDAPAVSVSQQYKAAGNSIVVDVLAAIYGQLWYPKAHTVEHSLFDALPAEPVDNNEGEKVFITTFSGYDSQLMAADALREGHPGFKWTCAGWSEIDGNAALLHDLAFPQYADKALGDITKVDWHAVKESLGGRGVDMLTYSSPCQDISVAGKQAGLKEGSGTRSALLWHVEAAVAELRPKYLLMENVPALVSKKFLPDFHKWLARLERLGYTNRWARLNARDFGVPQNRDRVFCLSMRGDVAFDYRFPEPRTLDKRLENILEDDTEERFFLKDDAVGKFLKANDDDGAVYVEYDIPPRHGDAMFVKTWLQRTADIFGFWEKKPDEVQAALALFSDGAFRDDYAKFKERGEFALGEDFALAYRENLAGQCE